MRLVCAIVLILGLAWPAYAQDERGWSFSGSFNGSVNSAGAVTKLDPTLGYDFNKYVSTYAGLPFYFVNLSTGVSNNGGFMSGVGNAFLGFRAQVDSDVMNYASTLEFTAPTGDKSRGFSTGHVTADWTNRFSRRFSSVTPFASVGIANTVSDTVFFVRPFSSWGLIGHFEGGATYDLTPLTWLGASGYAVRGSGEQRIISKVIGRNALITRPADSGREKNRIFETQTETISAADIINDHGFSMWLGASPSQTVQVHAGYSRSMNYDYNTFFFGIGFHVGR
jgi:hypothetical protein